MEKYDIDFASPQALSHGLLGTQGWSPSSSIGSDDGISDKYHAQISLSFPQPPFRLHPVLPLCVKKPRVVSELSLKDQALIRGFDSWGFDGEAERDAAIDGDGDQMMLFLEGLGIYTPEKPAKKPMHIDLPDYHRRIVSAPAPPAYLEILNGFDESPEQEPDEYPFPIMPHRRYSYSMEEEEDKLERLKESLSLGQGDDMSSANCDMAANTLEHPFKLVLSPEHQAPSLAEQMAFASGQGESYTWSSPRRRRSSSAYYLPAVVQDEPIKARDLRRMSSQDERKMASRHVRQGVAANGSAPLPRSVSMQTAMSGQEAEVGSNWSHKGCDDSDGESSDEEQFWLHPAQPMDRSSFSQQSACMSSTIHSLDSSPILHGVLSAHDFADQSSSGASSEVDTPSTCATSVQSIDLVDHKQVDVADLFAKDLPLQGQTPVLSDTAALVDSPNSLHEFSYLLDESHTSCMSPSADDHRYAEENFNGNTFSPALGVFDLDLDDMPPTPIDFAPSPLIDQASIEPHPSVVSEKDCPTIPLSFSTSSILERPRPVCRSAVKTSFFGNNDEILATRQAMVKSKSATCFQECRQPSTLPIAPTQSRPVIPDRRSSLDAASLISPKGNQVQEARKKTHRRGLSVSFVEEPVPTPAHESQSEIPVGIPASNSTSRMSSKALNQVREACRAKALLFGSSDKAEIAKEKFERAIASYSNHSSSASSISSSVSDSARVALPTLLVARTDSQRKRGWTGVAETEPHALILARSGVQTKARTRQSTAEALMSKPDMLEQGAVLKMPQGVVLIVEEKSVVREAFTYV